MIMASLRWRLLLGAAAAILAALALAWLFMTVLFERHLERRLEAEMTRDAIALVAATTLAPDGRPVVVGGPADPRLQKPAGGYYWQLGNAAGAVNSRSLWDAALPAPDVLPTDRWRLRRAPGPYGEPLVLLERQLQLESSRSPVQVQLAQDTRPLVTARAEFGRELAVFLALLWAVLSAAAWLQVSLGLKPLRGIRGELAALRDSARARLPVARLSEIQPLAEAINGLADAREQDLERARRRAADLAHGLKTPLSALSAQSRRAREAGAGAAADGMDRAIAAITATVEAELARARVAIAGLGGAASSPVRATVEALVTVLEHTEKGGELAFAIDVPADLHLPVAVDALSEILGSVLENAVRHARRQVRVLASTLADGRVQVCVEDDGPGIAGELLREALERGARLDETGAGSGLGLAIARDLAGLTGGSLELGAAALGGLQVCFTWGAVPPAR